MPINIPAFNPIILKIGSISLTYYSLVYIIGFIAIIYILMGLSRKNKIPLKENEVYDFIIILILGTLIGVRVFHILFWDFEYFSSHLIEIFYIWNGGLSFHGGLLGAIVFSALYCKVKQISFYKIADSLVIPSVFFLGLGRIANLINNEIIGKATSSDFCFTYENIQGCRHPIQIYSAIGRFALFFILLKFQKNKKESGFLFYIFILLIGIGRFILDFLREDVIYFYLTIGQWLSLILVLVSGFILIKKYFTRQH